MEFLKSLHHLDKDITLAINSLHCPTSDWIWQLFSNKEIWFILYLACAILLFRNLRWKRALIALACMILIVVSCDQGSNLVKDWIQRLRPCCDGGMIAGGLRCLSWHTPIEYGFFSAHAANAMGFAVGIWRCFSWDKTRNYRIFGIIIIIWAFLVGLSRIFVGMHFAGDVAVGFCIGALAAWLWTALGGILAQKTGR